MRGQEACNSGRKKRKPITANWLAESHLRFI